MLPPTAEHLFAQFRADGDPQALGALFDRTGPHLLSLALHLCGNPADAEDALQATFVTAITRAASWDASRPVQPWLCGILALQCKRVGERRMRRREVELPQPELLLDDGSRGESPGGSPVDVNERRELVGKLREHIDRLPQEQRQVLLLQLEHWLSAAEVAEVLGVPPGTVRMRLHRAIKALRGLMPAGLLALLIPALPARGLAAVRAAVVQHAGSVGTVTVGAGGLLMKKLLAGVAVVALLVLGWAVAPFFRSENEPNVPTPARLVVSSVEREPATTESPLLTNSSERAAVTLRDAREPVTTTGSLLVRVSYSGGAGPVPNAPLRIVPDRSDVDDRFECTTAVTGVDGRCTLTGLAPGKRRVATFGSSTGLAEVRDGETTLVDLTVDAASAPLTPVAIAVVHADGAPAAGAAIVVGAQGSDHAEVVATTGAAGTCELTLARGFLLVGARLAGFAPTPLRSWNVEAGVKLVLPGPGARLIGTVVDEQGAPIADAVVEVGEPRGPSQWHDPGGWLAETPPPQRLRSDASGRFVAADLPADELGIAVRADGFAPFHRYVRTTSGTDVNVCCQLARGVAVVGRVVDEAGQAVAGAWVGLGGTHGESRRTDADGRFGYRHTAPGPQQLEVSGKHIATTRSERAADASGEWVVVVHRWSVYTLRFVDENDASLANWLVGLGANRRVSVTAADGRVVLPAAGGAEAQLFVGPPGSIDAFVPVRWPAGVVPDREATITLGTAERPAGVVTGRVLAADGRPLPAGQVELHGAAGGYLFRHPLAEGRFTFACVPPGDWIVAVNRAGRGSAGGRFPVTGLAHGERRALGDLQLPREGSLAIRVVSADGTVPRDASVFLFDHEGHEHFAPPRDNQSHPWPEGRYTWKVMADDALWHSGDVLVRAGEPANIDVVLRPGVRRFVEFPVPTPAWGEPRRVDFVLRAPDGSVYDRGDFAPADEMPFRYMPPLTTGTWRVELQTDDGRRFAGSFELDSMAPSRDPIRVAVRPAQ